MTDQDESNKNSLTNETVIGFPQSRTRAKKSKESVRDLGLSKFAQQMDYVQPNLKGHWCSRCKGIWYGYVGECECPQCGNRHG